MGTPYYDTRARDREDIPQCCPECGGAIHVEEKRLEPGAWIEGEWRGTLYLDWWCVVDPDHDCGQPIALAH